MLIKLISDEIPIGFYLVTNFKTIYYETRGGTRKGSGAKPKYNEPTKTIAFRVPESKIEHIKSIVKTLLDGWSLK